jgi:hypothetical protein
VATFGSVDCVIVSVLYFAIVNATSHKNSWYVYVTLAVVT